MQSMSLKIIKRSHVNAGRYYLPRTNEPIACPLVVCGTVPYQAECMLRYYSIYLDVSHFAEIAHSPRSILSG